MPDNMMQQGLNFAATQMGYPGMDMPPGQGQPQPSLGNILALLQQLAMQNGGYEAMQAAQAMPGQVQQSLSDVLGMGPPSASGPGTYVDPGMSPMRR